jgi:hypothetical protein
MGMKAYAGKTSSVATETLIKHFSKVSGDIDIYEHIKNITLPGA